MSELTNQTESPKLSSTEKWKAQEKKEQDSNTTDHLPSIADIPENFIDIVNQRSLKLQESMNELTALKQQLETQRKNTNTVVAQVSQVLSEQLDHNEIITKVSSFLTTIRQESELLATATQRLLAGKDASSILNIDSSRFREIRTPQNPGDLITRILAKDKHRLQDKKDNFNNMQWSEVAEQSNKIRHQEIRTQITNISELKFPDLKISLEPEIAGQQITNDLPQFLASLRTLKKDLSFLESLKESLLQENFPEIHDKRGNLIET